MKEASKLRMRERKIKAMPRDMRPRCGARTRVGGQCQAQALLNKKGEPGRCRMHGGLSCGPNTPEGKAAAVRRARSQMLDRWARLRADGKTAIQLSPEGLERRRQSARRNMRIRHRRREALEWADWLQEQLLGVDHPLWGRTPLKILWEPFAIAVDKGGIEELAELASLIGIDLGSAPDDTDLTSFILARYLPTLNIQRLADDFRKAAAVS